MFGIDFISENHAAVFEKGSDIAGGCEDVEDVANYV